MSNPQNEIKFYDKGNTYGRSNGKDYYEFTNFFPASFNISEIPKNLNLSSHLIGDWKTSEHLFQAAKFTDKDKNIIEEIRQEPEPRGAFLLANSRTGKYKDKKRSEWSSISIEVMRWVVKEKFTQNEQLKEILLETGNAKLTEDSPTDNFWGIGDGSGRNELGKILMEIRSELKPSQGPTSNLSTSPTNPPLDPSQPTSPNNNPNSPEPTNNNKPPKPNQPEENNSPTNNNGPNQNPTNNDNDKPNKEKNDNFLPENPDSPQPSELPADIPSLDTERINNAETPEKACQDAQQQIQQLFIASKVEPNDLDKSLWKNKNSWEEFLKSLKNNREIADFAQKMAKEIKEKQQSRQNKKNNFSPNSNSSNRSKILAWSVGSGILLAILISLVFIFRQRAIRKRNHKRIK